MKLRIAMIAATTALLPIALGACGKDKPSEPAASAAGSQAVPADPYLAPGAQLSWLVGSWHVAQDPSYGNTEDSYNNDILHIFNNRLVREEIRSHGNNGDPEVPRNAYCHLRETAAKIKLSPRGTNEFELASGARSVELVPNRRNSSACSIVVERKRSEYARYNAYDSNEYLSQIMQIGIPKTSKSSFSTSSSYYWYTSNRAPVVSAGTTCMNLSGTYASASDLEIRRQLEVTQTGCSELTIKQRSWKEEERDRNDKDAIEVIGSYTTDGQPKVIAGESDRHVTVSYRLTPAGLEITKSSQHKATLEVTTEKSVMTLDSIGDLVMPAERSGTATVRHRQKIFQKQI